MAALVEHYKNTELAEPEDEESGKAHSTRSRLNSLLNRWVLPRWGKENIGAIKTVAVEKWLRTLLKTERRRQNRQEKGHKLGQKFAWPAVPEQRSATPWAHFTITLFVGSSRIRTQSPDR